MVETGSKRKIDEVRDSSLKIQSEPHPQKGTEEEWEGKWSMIDVL